jgi:multimeric flavodoxin WrbA
MNRKFLALIGSPRPNSTSSHLAQYLADGLAARGWQAQVIVACAAIRRPEKWPELESAFREADAVAVVAPLYVDSAPAELTTALERLAHVRTDRTGRLIAVVNCGFAEASQNDVALEIYRLFAREAGLHWAGGLAIGEGGMLAGKPLAAQGGKARNVVAAFDQTIAALDAGEDIPESAAAGIRSGGIPTWAYCAIANFSMIIGAAKHGNLFRIGATPYARK